MKSGILASWHSDNGIGHINKVKLCQVGLVLRLVTTFGRSIIPVFLQATQPVHPSTGGRNEYWRWFQLLLEKKRRVLRSSKSCYQNCWHTDLLYGSLIGSNPVWLEGQRGGAQSCQTSYSTCSCSCSIVQSLQLIEKTRRTLSPSPPSPLATSLAGRKAVKAFDDVLHDVDDDVDEALEFERKIR